MAQNGNVLKFMSFNIQNGQGMDGNIDIDRTAEVINNEYIDILCLQEVECQIIIISGFVINIGEDIMVMVYVQNILY